MLEKAFMQQKLGNLSMQRACQQAQAKAAQADAIAEKARRVCTKGARRSREINSRARLLQTKIDRLASDSNLLQLHATIDDMEEGVQRAQEEASNYKSKFWRSEVWHK